MTAPGTQLFTTFQTGKESSHGTAVATTRQWYGQGSGEIDIDRMLSLHRGNRGTRTNLAYATSAGIAVKIAFQSDTDIGCAYDELPFIFGQLDGGNSGSGGGANKTWTIAPSQTGANSQESYTIHVADDVQGYEMEYCQASDFTLSAGSEGMTQLAVNWFARQPTKASATSVSANKAVRIQAKKWVPRWASAQSGLSGASDVLNFMRDFSITHQTGLVPIFYQDGLAYFGQSVEALPQTATMTLHVESTSSAISRFYDNWTSQTTDFMQLTNTGPSLGGSNYSAQLQYAWLYTDVKPIASVENGINIYEVTAETVIDGTWGTNFAGSFVCSISSIT